MSIARLAIFAIAAITLASPASAQLGGLKKKLKKATEGETQAPAADPTPAAGGSVVLTPDVVNKLITGLKAGDAEREKAVQSDDNAYGRYQKAQRDYTDAQAKCETNRQAWAMKGNAKEADKANELIERSLKAQEKQDYKTAQMLQDSVSLLQGGPSCLVKQPERPTDYYEAEREIDVRAQKAAVTGSGLGAGEYAMAQERTIAILRSGAPSDVSESEKAAVAAKKSQLEPLLFPQEKPRAAKPAAQAAPPPQPAAAPQVDPQASAAASSMSSCMMKNMESHQAQIEALGKRAEAAQKAGNQAAMMAIADTVQRIQMAGCTGK